MNWRGYRKYGKPAEQEVLFVLCDAIPTNAGKGLCFHLKQMARRSGAYLLECVTTIVHPSFKNLGFIGWGIFGVVSILQITGGEFWGEFLPIS